MTAPEWEPPTASHRRAISMVDMARKGDRETLGIMFEEILAGGRERIRETVNALLMVANSAINQNPNGDRWLADYLLGAAMYEAGKRPEDFD